MICWDIVIDNKLFCVFCGIFVSLILDTSSLVLFDRAISLYNETTRLSFKIECSVFGRLSEARIMTIMPVPPSNWPLRPWPAYKCSSSSPLPWSAQPEGSLAIVVRPLLCCWQSWLLTSVQIQSYSSSTEKKIYVLVSKRFLRSHASTWGCHAMQSVIWCLLCWLRIVRLYSLGPLRFPDKITFPIIYFFWLNVEYV